jgi:uncharacterized protein (DUF1330 family)
MAAYIIVEVSIHDPELMQEYRKYVPATLAAYEGKFIVRGGQTTMLEGAWRPERIVVLEFPTVDKAKAWWDSDMYAEPKKIRQAAGMTKMIIVEGVFDR